MAAYGKEDFIFTGFDDYDFSDFSDFSDEERSVVSVEDATHSSESDNEEIRQYCVCSGPLSKQMIACDRDNCAIEWWHYECAGLTEQTIPEGDWFCPKCLQSEAEAEGRRHFPCLSIGLSIYRPIYIRTE